MVCKYTKKEKVILTFRLKLYISNIDVSFLSVSLLYKVSKFIYDNKRYFNCLYKFGYIY